MVKADLQRVFPLIVLLSVCFPACAQSGEQQPTPSPAPPTTDSPASPSSASPGDSTQLIVISASKPSYPMEAAKQGVQGRVWIHLLISETGEVESSDIVSGDPDLARAAQQAMKKWKFKPYIRNGKPVKVDTKMPYDFAFQSRTIDIAVPPDLSTSPPASPAEAAGTTAEGSSGNLPLKLRVSSGVAEGLKVHDVTPTYPIAARMAHIQGDVILQATIGKDGLIHNLKAVTGDPILVKAAMGAVEQWRYRPYVLKGSPVEVETTIKIQFHM